MNRRAAAAVLASGALLHLAALHLRLPLFVWDPGGYLNLALSLRAGTGYLNHAPPFGPVPTHWPPLFPLLLAPVSTWWDTLPALLSLPSLAGTGLCAWLLARSGKDARVAAAAAAAFLLNGITLQYSTAVRPDMLHVALAFAAMMLALERPAADDKTLWRVGALCALSPYLRTHGTMLCAAFVFWVWARRGFKTALLAGAALAAATLPVFLFTDSSFYTEDYGGSGPRQFAHNLFILVGRNALDLFAGPASWWVTRAASHPALFGLKTLLSAGVFALLARAWWRHLRAHRSLIDFYAVTYLVPLLPYYFFAKSYRSLVPILPVALYYLFLSEDRPALRRLRLGLAAAFLAAGAGALPFLREHVNAYEQPTHASWDDMRAAYAAIRDLPADAVVLGPAPVEHVYLETGRHALMFPRDEAGLRDLFDLGVPLYVLETDPPWRGRADSRAKGYCLGEPVVFPDATLSLRPLTSSLEKEGSSCY